jgi:dTDP-4-amino-4,6-dideoxygalactose transaminase
MQRIPFNRPYLTGAELQNIEDAQSRSHLSGDGTYTEQCNTWLQEKIGSKRALLTHSCTAALELSALLLDLSPGDEVIMPSFTFVSTANAFVLRGAVPVFVDINPDTLNVDENRIEGAITHRTRAICVVHYAGVAANMDPIMAIAHRYGLRVVEDAAQGILARFKDRPLGSIGDLGTLSFHETKNIMCGEGGALLIRDKDLTARAEILREKGTNRRQFAQGIVDKYTWVDLGSSYLPGEISAAFLRAQLDAASEITERRMSIWSTYQEWAKSHEKLGRLRGPIIPSYAQHNAHLFYILLPSSEIRDNFIARMDERGVNTVFHYVPLHSSPMGAKYGKYSGQLPHTDDIHKRLVRLPLWVGLEPYLDRVLSTADEILSTPN